MTQRILIVGGGIGGLCAALGLQNAGFKVAVFEQARAFAEVGAGISIGVTADRALNFLGVGKTIKDASDVPQKPFIGHYKTGLPVAGFHTGKDAPYDPSVVFHQIHRADLHAILTAAVTANDPDSLFLARKFVEFVQDAEGVTAIFADGGKVRGDALIGCDGLRSTVREMLFLNENPKFTGQVAWRFLMPADIARPMLHVGESAHYMGPGHNVTRYLIRHKSILNVVAFAVTDSWTEEGWSIRSSREELLDQFSGWHEDILGLIRNAPKDGIYKWALFDRDPLKVWTDRRVTLLGDAAHPILPFLGLGAAIAIEDSALLARAMTRASDIPAGLKLYEAARKGRTTDIMLASRKQGEVYNSVDPDHYQEADRPTANLAIYNYDPATAPLPAGPF